MAQYQIITEFGELDVNDNVDIAITKQLEDLLNITKRKTDWTKTIAVPGTPGNNLYFSNIYEVNIDVNGIGFNPVKRVAASILCGVNQVMTGYLQLMDVENDNGNITYNISIAGSLRNIFNDFEDFTLGNLDFSEYNHVRNQTNIVDSWDYKIYQNGQQIQLQGPGKGYVYGYAVNGNSQDIWDTWYTYDAYPQIYMVDVVKKMFDFLGKSFTSEFFDSEYAKMQVLNYVGDKIQLSDEEIKRRTVAAGVNPATPFAEITPVQSRGSDWYYNNYNGYYLGLPRETGVGNDNGIELTFRDDLNQFDGNILTCSKTGRYNVNFEGKLVCKITHDDGDDVEFKEGNFLYRYQMILLKNDGTQPVISSSVDPNDPNDVEGVLEFQMSDGVHATPWYDTDNPLLFSVGVEDLFMEAGDKIKIRFGFKYPDSVKWYGLDDNKHKATLTFVDYLDGFTKFTCEPSSNEDFGDSEVDMNQILDRNKKLKDAFLDIVDLYQLIIMDNPNKPNDIIIEPRDKFFESRQRIWNWDEEEILDLDSKVVSKPMSELDSKIYRFTYTEDEDFYNKEYEEETKRIYGDYEIEVLNDFSDKIKTTKVGFAATPSAQKFIDSRVAPFLCDYQDNELKPVKTKQRILFYGGSKDLNSGSVLKIKNYPGQSDANSTIVTRYGYIGMWDDPQDPRYSLEFGRPNKIYWNSNKFPTQNLFEMFHKSTLNNIIDANARLLEVTARLTPKMIAEFDFRDIVFLLGSYWRVMTIKDYSPIAGDTLTDVTLYKIVDMNVVNQYQIEIPTSNSTCPSDTVSLRPKKNGQVVIVSQSGLLITEDCCKSFGGQFKEGICYGKSRPAFEGVMELAPVKSIIKGGLDVVPTSEPNGPQSIKKNNTSRNTIGVKTLGSGIYVPGGANTGFVMGNNSTIGKNVVNSFIVGDGITAQESGTFYLGNIKINQDGNIVGNGIVIIDGGEDEVFNFDRTNAIDVLDGTKDSVRNPDGDSKARPIIDGSERIF